MKRPVVIVAASLALLASGAYVMGYLSPKPQAGPSIVQQAKPAKDAAKSGALLPAVTVTAATSSRFVDSVLVNGSLVARNEFLVAPEVEGLRIVELGAEEGDSVSKGQILARLEQETLESQLAQNEAALARTAAAIAQAQSQIAQAEARLAEAQASFERAQPLKKSGVVSDAVYDQREAAARTAAAQLAAAHDGLKLAEAERALSMAQRREISWRRSRIEIRAPVDGLVSRRTARLGGMATAIGEPMFRMAAGGEIELEAEVPEADMGRLEDGQSARITIAGAGTVRGAVRLVSPEVDRATRLGKVRVYLGANRSLRIGAFGRGTIEVATGQGLAVPATAVLFTAEGAQVLVVIGDAVETRRVKVGLVLADQIEITSGLAAGELVVAKSGSFLRDGDLVRPIRAAADKVSKVN